ncbi:hypothetical protein BLL52_0133 [Rhodoferax antarcticus ANT.BR]|uniref:Uncharacterized protein n=1 Tax=Rhodoferax antarcticus ANT.BR TaxID=1111071 RepID=A0A1Q8YKF0_9BURK|nr:hypothetical protein BLL52_0133 [Rhodoferax antarcticus ANT.BR]
MAILQNGQPRKFTMTSKGQPFLSAAANSSGKEVATVNPAALATVALAALMLNKAPFNHCRLENSSDMARITRNRCCTLAT